MAPYLPSRLALDTLSTLLFSLTLSRLFQHRPAVALTRFLHHIMHSAAFPFVSTLIVPRLPFLLSTRFPFFYLFDARFVCSICHNAPHIFDVSSPILAPFPIALPIFSTCTSYFQTESLFFNIYFNVERRCPLRTAMTWIRSYRSMLCDAVTFFLPYFDLEPAASGSFSFSRRC